MYLRTILFCVLLIASRDSRIANLLVAFINVVVTISNVNLFAVVLYSNKTISKAKQHLTWKSCQNPFSPLRQIPQLGNRSLLVTNEQGIVDKQQNFYNF